MYKAFKTRGVEISQNKTSDRKTALVVQGGGMRGIYSMAALMAIEDMGLYNSFDKVYGSSAGALNGAYFLAGQSKTGVSVYLDDISNKKFIDFLRLQKIVDIDYLVDEVIKSRKRLNVDKLFESSSELQMILFNYYTANSEVFTNRQSNYDFLEAIRATAALPILYNRNVKVRDQYYIDGGIEDGVPLFRAIEDGCTDIIVILTRPTSFRRNALSLFMHRIQNYLMRNYPVKTKNKILNSTELFNNTMDYIENPRSNNIDLHIIAPSNMKKMVSRTTSNRNDLLDCALMGINDARSLFDFEMISKNPFR